MQSAAYGGLVMPCLDPVLMMMAAFSWWIMEGTKVCWTFTTLAFVASTNATNNKNNSHAPKEVHIHDLVPVIQSLP